MNQNITVLILGASGFIGSAAANFYAANGYKVIGVGRYKSDAYLLSPLVTYISLLSTGNKLADIIATYKPDICINAIGKASVSDSFVNPLDDYVANTYINYQALDAIRINNPQACFVFLSSAAVYGAPTMLPIAEHFSCNPLSPYGLHKQQAEMNCQEFSEMFDVKTIVLRIFSAYGPGLKRQIMWDTCQKLCSHENTLEFYGSGDESRDYIYIDDVVQAINRAIYAPSEAFTIYNVASGEETNIRTLVHLLASTFSSEQEIKFSGSVRLGDPSNWLADISKMVKIGFSPKTSLRQGLENYSKWYQKLL